MSRPRLHCLSLRYSSWSIRPWLALHAAGIDFETVVVDLPEVGAGPAPMPEDPDAFVRVARERLEARRRLGSVSGTWPVLEVDGVRVHESLAICEWAAETTPGAGLWPAARLERARARAICAEFASGFPNLRGKLPCHVFARVEGFAIDAATRVEIERVFEIWRDCLARSGGPFLLGGFGIVDAFWFPVVTRFRTYGVALPEDLDAYAARVEGCETVGAWRALATKSPALPGYDAAMRKLGGDPMAAFPER